MTRAAAVALALLGLAAAPAAQAAQAASEASADREPPLPEECAVLAALDFAEAVGAGVKLAATLAPATGELPARCRVTGTVAPKVGVEVWLPVEAWNGKLLVTGCYGLCGAIRADQMEDAAIRGYATATTDGGHDDADPADARWAWNDTAREDDFGHRAVHVTTLLAKALTEAYYGNRESHAYFRGCSNGGRQGLVAAGRYPDDFDGIIAGAPFNQALSVPHMIWADRANAGADGRPLLKKPQLELLRKGALAACDAADGLADGVIGDPESCAFRPDSLACPEGAPADAACLAPAQVEAAAKIYGGAVDGAGRHLHPAGAAPGSEGGWEQGLVGRDGRPSFFHATGQQWLHFHAFEPDPPADAGELGFDFDRDPPRLAASVARIGYTPALERFDGRDGKLIVWHGWADESLLPAHTLAWWQAAQRENGAAALARFARLYLLPGVQHCGGGPGAGDVDYLAALERWVEDDEAPDMLVALRTKDSVPATVRQPRFPPAAPVEMKRPVYPWPGVARYDGHGDPLDPASFPRVSPGAPPPTTPPPPAAPPPAGGDASESTSPAASN